jgi:hypothetical protein
MQKAILFCCKFSHLWCLFLPEAFKGGFHADESFCRREIDENAILTTELCKELFSISLEVLE